MDHSFGSYASRALAGAFENPTAGRIALRALRKAHQLLSLALGKRLAQMRESDLSHNSLGGKIQERALQLSLLREANAILVARWDKIPERQRPHYTPEQRYRIIRVKDLFALSQREAAQTFAVAVNTIARWETAAEASPQKETVGSLVQSKPPVRRYADVLRHLVQTMALCGFGGNDLIARTLARAGWKLSSRTVGRIRKEKLTRPPLAESCVAEPTRGTSTPDVSSPRAAGLSPPPLHL